MASPVPKPPEVRRNRNPKAHGDWVDITARRLDKSSVPPLSALKAAKGEEWSASLRARWDIWRHDPVTEHWTEADVLLALDTLRMFRDAEPQPREMTDGTIIELPGSLNWAAIDRHLDRLYLSPKGKRDGRFRIVFAPWRDTTLDDGQPLPDTRGDNVSSLDERRMALAAGV